MSRSSYSPWLAFTVVYTFYIALAAAVSSQEPLKLIEKSYVAGEAISVSCLNRTIDTGEHITDEQGQLEYIPFPTCNETGRPLELHFGIEKEINCTIEFIDDAFFHLLEFYVHNDAPLTCRIPSRPLPSSILPSSSGTGTGAAPPADEYTVSDESTKKGAMGTQSTLYTPLIMALAGTLQLSHLHISNALNLLVHAAPKAIAPGTIDAAAAYSVSAHTRQARVSIGDPLTLQFSVRWYPGTVLPSGWRGMGGHLYTSTIVYCLLSAGASAAICVAYFRGVELPRRLRRYARDKAYGGGGGGYGLPVSNGGGYNGYGYGVGKRD
ncbi:uncharacterized protein BDZ99DRAFT_469711 [Mytilinidion resinicola]|uniref:Uncharacterized protein n=1 Tax=Mytilinidion resinicola TaxID=574789 RepID=A0A6A6XXV7_9PEZI|nr:uncharacterized protein BDZ99DRAFT_469711 [Mytilinidion resinicola]KAF2801386.1 hypothetical protein BDZ99DRAFT_469711 [Mytilinidion resinicola]